MRTVLLGVLIVAAMPVAANTVGCAGGSVFLDRNGNGVRDAREPGLAGVAVSDGERIVSSDRKGRYRLDTESGKTTFLIKPAGFHAFTRADGLADVWANVQLSAGPTLRYGGVPSASPACKDFALVRDHGTAGTALDVLVFGDPQPKSLLQVGYYQRDIVAPLQGKQRAQLAISLGDLVDDNLSLYPALKAVDATLRIPWLHAPGNHDLDFDAGSDEQSLGSFRHAFGPDTYAWEEAQANFLVLDDVIYLPGNKPAYIGGFREQQFNFLSAYLATADKQKLLVLAMHIPLFDASPGVATFRHADRERLFALLLPFANVLVLSAHSHSQRHFFHGPASGWLGDKPLHEYNVGAACGAYWTGLKDAAGIPAATMSDGTPNGHALLSVDRGAFKLRWFAARAADDFQIALHAPKVLRHGAYPAFAVYANIFMGQDDTVVEYRIDDGAWKPMVHTLQADPGLLAENALDDAAQSLRGFDRSPEASPSAHVWRGTLATDLHAGSHKVSVRANIEGYGLAQASTDYRLDDASP